MSKAIGYRIRDFYDNHIADSSFLKALLSSTGVYVAGKIAAGVASKVSGDPSLETVIDMATPIAAAAAACRVCNEDEPGKTDAIKIIAITLASYDAGRQLMQYHQVDEMIVEAQRAYHYCQHLASSLFEAGGAKKLAGIIHDHEGAVAGMTGCATTAGKRFYDGIRKE